MKTRGVTSVLLLTLVLAGLSAGEAQEPPVLQPSELCSEQPDSAIATFEDANLEARVRTVLSVGGQEDLTCALLSGLMGLTAPRAGIESLLGMQNLTGLTMLDLYTSSITDISALGGLTTLTELHLPNAAIADISALSGLTSLTSLHLDGNSISDISAVSALTGLTFLNLGSNSISDISAVSGLTSPRQLYLSFNPISDISALSGLTSLTDLGLGNNPDLSDIQPLLDNTGLGLDDEVNLRSTSVSCTDLAALRAKMRVIADC